MSASSENSGSFAGSPLKLAFAILLLCGGVAFVYAQYRKVQPDFRAERNRAVAAAPGPQQAGGPTAGPREFGPPSEAEREAMRQQFVTQLQLTPEQQKRIDEIRAQGGDGNWRERMQQMREVLTPEQQEKAQEMFQQRFQQRMQERLKVLPPAEQAKFMEKLEERRQQWGGRGPGGGPGWSGRNRQGNDNNG